MDSARFQLVAGLRAGDRLVPPWPTAPDAAPAPAVWVAWRLLSRNHRDLARSPAVHADVAECLASVARLRERAASGRTFLVRNPANGRWTWRLETDDGDVVAVGSRGYLRRRECHDCVAQVVELAPVALAPDPDAVLATRPAPSRFDSPPSRLAR